MRPLRLEIAAFGPFLEPQALDFRALAANPLFLLTGPTGSGKTMLLDAMCYALFGVCSGEAREPRTVRSHWAEPHQKTEVEFEFSVGAESYRVRRSPEQERPKARGQGTTRLEAQATLWRTTAADGEGEFLTAQPVRVTEEVERILGFSAAQFRQVTMLPQGDFQRFLQAKSDERESILEVLFQTSRYKRIEEALAARSAAARSEAETGRAELQALLRQAQVETSGELAPRLQDLEQRRCAAVEELSRRREASKLATSHLEAGRDQDRRVREREAAERAYDALESGREANQQSRAELDLARRAAVLEPQARERDTRRAEMRERERDAAAAVEQATAAASAHARAQKTLETEAAREPEREAARRQVQQYQELSARAGELAEARRAADAAQQRLAAARKSADGAGARWKANRDQAAAARAELRDAEPQASPLERLRAEIRDLETALERRKLWEAASRKLAGATEQLTAAEAKSAYAAQAFETARRAAEDLEHQWSQQQAALLAAGLAEGQPCPVCGSTSHPAPAAPAPGAPTEAKLKSTRAARNAAEATRDEAAAAAQRARLEAEKLATAVEEKAAALGEHLAADLPAGLKAARAAVAAAQTAAEQVANRRAECDRLDAEEPALRSNAEQAGATLQAADRDSASAASVLREREDAVPETLRAPGALERELQTAQGRAKALLAALDQARQAAATSAQHQAAAETRRQETEAALLRAQHAANEASLSFEAAITAAGFAGEPAWQQARREPARIAALETAIRKFEDDVAAAEDRLRRAREHAAGLKAPDLPALERACAEANRAVEDGAAAVQDLGRSIGDHQRWIAQAAQLEAALAEADRRFTRLARLSDAASGRIGERISLHRFVLTTWLDRVLQDASRRLRLMSRERYQLRRAESAQDRRRVSGLELEVFDAHTGLARRVQTLSGGESFLASLALSLGLASAVQNQAGGIHLESIFIDEGFGSLDDEVLELAIRVLRDLQQGGRLVGIISHVAELKEQIRDARIEVTPQRRGSVARLVLG